MTDDYETVPYPDGSGGTIWVNPADLPSPDQARAEPTPARPLEELPLHERDELIAQALRFMVDRGYRISHPADVVGIVPPGYTGP